jgi:hypothetical protein
MLSNSGERCSEDVFTDLVPELYEQRFHINVSAPQTYRSD